MKSYDDFVKTAGVKNFVSKVSGKALRDTKKKALQDYKESLAPYIKSKADLRRKAKVTSNIYNTASDIYDLAVRQQSKALRNGSAAEEIDKLSQINKGIHKMKSFAERDMLNTIGARKKVQKAAKSARDAAKEEYKKTIDEAVVAQNKARKQLAIGGGITLGALLATGAISRSLRKKREKDEEKTAAVKFAQIESPSPAEKKHMNEDEKYVDAPVVERKEKCAGRKGLSKKDRAKILKMLNLSGAEK